MAEPVIRASRVEIADDCIFGDDVVIEAEEIHIGPGCKIGWSGGDDFRTPGGVRIKVRRLELGPGVALGRALRMEGGEVKLDEGVRIMRHATINVLDLLHLSAYGTVGERCEISGRHIETGQELWMLPQVKIGGGSAFEVKSRLKIGHFVHLGVQMLVNTARPVVIGDEVALGTRSSIFTHAAYLSRLMGYPADFAGVEIGDFAYIPGAIINPGVRIGRNCVIGVNSLVRTNIPDGAFAAGSPARVIRANAYPAPLTTDQRLAFFEEFLGHFGELIGSSACPRHTAPASAVLLADEAAAYVAAPVYDPRIVRSIPPRARVLVIADGAEEAPENEGWTLLDTATRHIRGVADAASSRLTNELRRFGMRFYSRGIAGCYVDWGSPKPLL